jgi:hypothetical protein
VSHLGTITGTITAADVSTLPVTNSDSVIPQGIQPGDLAGMLMAMFGANTYVKGQTTTFPKRRDPRPGSSPIDTRQNAVSRAIRVLLRNPGRSHRPRKTLRHEPQPLNLKRLPSLPCSESSRPSRPGFRASGAEPDSELLEPTLARHLWEAHTRLKGVLAKPPDSLAALSKHSAAPGWLASNSSSGAPSFHQLIQLPAHRRPLACASG